MDQINIHLGERIKKRRLQMALGLRTLGEAVGVTAQQIQKYEKGQDRIFASRLFLVAAALRIPVSYFYKGLAIPVAVSKDRRI